MKRKSFWIVTIWAAFALGAAMVSCGESARIETGASSSSSSGAGGMGGSAGGPIVIFGSGGNVGVGGNEPGDASVDVNYMPALFDCQGCACDGTTHYCRVDHAGAQKPPAPDAGACPDGDGGMYSHCIPLPSECLPIPTCECLDPFGGACQCELLEGAAGYFVECFLP